MNKDTIFNTKQQVTPFKFNAEVANVFDNMAHRSIPFYNQLLELIADLTFYSHQDANNVHIYDLGCSTGNLIFYLQSKFTSKNFTYTGIDNSKEMLKIASSRYQGANIYFKNTNLLNVKNFPSDIICANFILQFIKPTQRKDVLINIYNSLKSRGIFFLSEKNLITNPKIHHLFDKSYIAYKKKQGYSNLEISQKRDALENVLITWSKEQYIQILQEIGFKVIEPIFQWGLFSSLMLKKC